MWKDLLQPISICALVLISGCLAAAQEKCTAQKIFSAIVCDGDSLTPNERSLFDAVNAYRVANGLAALKLSTSLSMVGNRRMLDLNQNLKSTTHSWSNCPYDIKDEKTWPCLTRAPERLSSGYAGQGYETLYRISTGEVDPKAAVDAWKKSALHSSIILNQGIFKAMSWDEMGVAIGGQFAALWFGYSGNATKTLSNGPALTTADIAKMLGISGSTTASGWVGTSVDKKRSCEIIGSPLDLSSSEIRLSLFPVAPDAGSRGYFSELLIRLIPEWSDAENWVETSLLEITRNASVKRVRRLQNVSAEMTGDGKGGVKLTVYPKAKPRSVEM